MQKPKVKRTRIRRPRRRRQSGVALIVGLVLLAVLTVIGITAMQSTTLEERMAGNYQSRTSGFQAAEAALRAGEQALMNNTFVFDNTNGHYRAADPGEPPRWLTIYGPGAKPAAGATVPLLPAGGDCSTDSSTDCPQGSSQASYFIEELPTFVMPGRSLTTAQYANEVSRRLYQITAFGTDRGGQATIVLQSVFRP